MDNDAIRRFVERAARELEMAEQALAGQALYLQQVAEGIDDESIHPDHLPVVGNRVSELRSTVDVALRQAEQYLYLAH